jgi:hypothetical protein
MEAGYRMGVHLLVSPFSTSQDKPLAMRFPPEISSPG